MATGKDLAADAAELCELIAEHNLTRLDFDELRQWLADAATVLAKSDSCQSDLATLREDYQARITGMLKAIAVAERSPASLESVADIVDSLSALSVLELIRCYRRTCACFRDRFPGSLTFPIPFH